MKLRSSNINNSNNSNNLKNVHHTLYHFIHSKLTFFVLSIFLITGTILTLNLNKKQLKASAYSPSDFVTTWNSGDDKIVKIPVYKSATGANGLSGYNYTIDWGDGSPAESFTDNTTPSHTYPNPNTEYQIVISGTFPGWTFNSNANNLGDYTDNSNMAKKLTKLNQWGTGTWKRMDSMFSYCSNLEAAYTDSPDTSNVTDMSRMFSVASKFNGALNFNTSNVTDMSEMFSEAYSFNQPVNFDTSNVTNMSSMFGGASSFNQPVNFDTFNVTNMRFMFVSATSFNQPLNFDTSNVTNMSHMFNGATSFNQPLNFNTSSVENISFMFLNNNSFNQDVSHFNFSNVTNLYNLMGFVSGTSAFSINNYDKLLQRWYDQLGGNGISYVNISSPSLKYCKAEAAREHLVKPVAEGGAGWQLTDSGKDCSGYAPTTITSEDESGNPVISSDPTLGTTLTNPITFNVVADLNSSDLSPNPSFPSNPSSPTTPSNAHLLLLLLPLPFPPSLLAWFVS